MDMDLGSSDGSVFKSLLVWGKKINIYFTNLDGDTLASPVFKVMPVLHTLEFCKELPDIEVNEQARYWKQSGF